MKAGFDKDQIKTILEEYKCGKKVADIIREYHIKEETFYSWKGKFEDSNNNDANDMIKQLQEENQRLKEMVTELSLNNSILKDFISKKSY